MEDIGSLVFYIILGLIALAGSFQGKGKKKPGAPKPVQRRPETASGRPQARTTTQATRPEPSPVRQEKPAPKPSPWFLPSEPSMEGRYDEPMAGDFSREGSFEDPLAGTFSREGSVASGMSEAFSREGSIADSMAAAFASEGISSLGDSGIGGFVHNEISDSEIGDAPDFDYNEGPGAELHTGGLDLKKAVIYSAVLDRKEYSY
jgi:hypothetical protein